MLRDISLRNFKSFRRVDLRLDRMNLLVGANASGKSNFLDALRVLQGIGNGFTVNEILDGKPESATSGRWEGIRGRSAGACLEGKKRHRSFSIAARGKESSRSPTTGLRREDGSGTSWDYSISVSPITGRVTHERLVGEWPLYDSTESDSGDVRDPVMEVRYHRGMPERPPHLWLERSRPVLRQFQTNNGVLPEDAAAAAKVADQLADVQRVHPSPDVLRGYSQAREVRRLGERGENFAALVDTICADPAAKEAYLEWMRELRPEEVDDVRTLKGALGEPIFMLREGGRDFAAPVLSDGTLRFAAMVATLFQPDLPRLMTIEGIENGVHPGRARLLVELLRRKAEQGDAQVVATTHSPSVLAWLTEAEHASTFFFRRDPDTGETSITPLRDIPNFESVIEKHAVGDLFAEGWMETAP